LYPGKEGEAVRGAAWRGKNSLPMNECMQAGR
jgi:hypothetical protein